MRVLCKFIKKECIKYGKEDNYQSCENDNCVASPGIILVFNTDMTSLLSPERTRAIDVVGENRSFVMNCRIRTTTKRVHIFLEFRNIDC